MTGESAKVIVYARHACGTRDTTQSEQRYPLDIGSKTQPCRQPRFQRGNGEPSDRRREHDVDLGRLDFGLCQCRLQRPLTQLECDVEVGVVGFGEAAELSVSRQWQRKVACRDTALRGEPLKLRTGEVGQGANHFVLAVPVRRELDGHRGDRRCSDRQFGQFDVRCHGTRARN